MFVPTSIAGQVPESAAASSARSQSNCDSDDSDWDDDDFSAQKFNIKIKPIAQVPPSKISASVDELRASIGTWKSMANINLAKSKPRRHHQSTVQLNNEGQQINDLRPTRSPPPPIALLNQQVTQDGITLGKIDNILPTNTMTTLEPKKSRSNVIGLINISNGQDSNMNLLSESCSVIVPQPFSSSTSSIVHHVSDLNNSSIQIPVAFVVQESLNVRSRVCPMGTSLTYLIGRLKLALPINSLNSINSNDYLVFSLITTIPWNKVDLNKLFVSDTDDASTEMRHFTSDSLNKRLTINMNTIKAYAKSLDLTKHQKSYFITPELLKYTIRSQDTYDEITINPKHRLNPVGASSHWLCGTDAIKIRINLRLIENALANQILSHRDIKNLRISVWVNAKVISQVSKPEAEWIASESRLVWFFPNMETLRLASTINGVTSCLARLEITGGLSTPNDTVLHFSIAGKTLSGTRVILDEPDRFKMVKQKFDIKTGIFVCEPITNEHSRVPGS